MHMHVYATVIPHAYRICLQTAGTVKNALRFCNHSVNRQRNWSEPTQIPSAAVHFQDLTDVEQRVLGCLIEKRWTTPDQYPLSINSLRLACNQSTNRDPVTRYTEDQVSQAGQRLSKYGLARLASGHTTRATKYRHLTEEGLGLNRDQLALLCVLLLRGPQTPGELKQRSERLVESELSLADVERVLSELTERGYVADLGRRPGQKEDRWAQLLGGEVQRPAESFSGVGLTASRDFDAPTSEERAEGPAADVYRPAPPPAATAAQVSALETRVAALEADLASLREQLADLLT
jgi:uncharacterized protein YceH (UPF0502 family)